MTFIVDGVAGVNVYQTLEPVGVPDMPHGVGSPVWSVACKAGWDVVKGSDGTFVALTKSSFDSGGETTFIRSVPPVSDVLPTWIR
jgi:hypothetical protein